jgi:hypothetical protein
MRKPKIRLWKDTLLAARPCHPECIEARNAIRDNSKVIPTTSPPPSNDEESGENDDLDNYLLCMLGEVVLL